jgi:hypothetical protein
VSVPVRAGCPGVYGGGGLVTVKMYGVFVFVFLFRVRPGGLVTVKSQKNKAKLIKIV